MGDVLTGDGIERVPDEQSLLAPDGGEGGSVLRTPGSKEVRARRRKEKKDSYNEYLASPEWRKIRARVLRRDKYKCRALSCSSRARVVHHRRYPKNLGEERLEWLYALCIPCHDAIHAMKGVTLRRATDIILGATSRSNVVYLPDDPRLSGRETQKHQQGRGRKGGSRARRGVKSAHVSADQRKKSKLDEENERLHQFFKENREKRQRGR